MGFAVALGAIVAGGLFFLAIGFRPDIEDAVKSVPFLFKFIVTLSLAVPAIGLCSRLARPGVPFGNGPLGSQCRRFSSPLPSSPNCR